MLPLYASGLGQCSPLPILLLLSELTFCGNSLMIPTFTFLILWVILSLTPDE